MSSNQAKRDRRKKNELMESFNATQRKRLHDVIKAKIERGVKIPYAELLALKLFERFRNDKDRFKQLVRQELDEAQRQIAMQKHRVEEIRRLQANLKETKQKENDMVNNLRMELEETQKMADDARAQAARTQETEEAVWRLREELHDARISADRARAEAARKQEAEEAVWRLREELHEAQERAKHAFAEAARKQEAEEAVWRLRAELRDARNFADRARAEAARKQEAEEAVWRLREELYDAQERANHARAETEQKGWLIDAGPYLESRVKSVYERINPNVFGKVDFYVMRKSIAEKYAAVHEQLYSSATDAKSAKDEVHQLLKYFWDERCRLGHEPDYQNHIDVDAYRYHVKRCHTVLEEIERFLDGKAVEFSIGRPSIGRPSQF